MLPHHQNFDGAAARQTDTGADELFYPAFQPDKLPEKKQSCQRQRQSKPGVEKGNKRHWYQTGTSKPDPAGHHEDHDAVGFGVKETVKWMGIVFVVCYSSDVFS